MHNCAKILLSELLGTFILVFTGTGAVVFNEISGGMVTPLGIALVFGFIVMALVYTLGDISGAHINPAVTLGFWATGKFESKHVMPYILAQCCGALLASLLLRFVFGVHGNMGATLPLEVDSQPMVYECLILEIILTFILMFVILNVATGVKEKGVFTGIVVGGVIALEAIFAGPISGASMNPARSLGPAVASGNYTAFWIYVLGPLVGSLLAVPAWRYISSSSEGSSDA